MMTKLDFNKERLYLETKRYLGYQKGEVTTVVAELIKDALQEVTEVAKPRFSNRCFPLVVDSETVTFGSVSTKSAALAENLKGCQEILVIACTLGTGIDLLIRRYSSGDMARVVVLQAASAAVLEAYLDKYNEELKTEYAKSQKHLRPRFSPGYGDFDLDNQEMILRLVEAAKTIGLTLTDGGMLCPTKSVTAVIGISDEELECERTGCMNCTKTDCTYRKDGC
ncbi:cobalamin-dependent methionine synthase I [Lachnospiraceae bacterium PF1-21]